jgi:3beta-hydroxy-delta5-steroid dehydrogenase/steroid delta-isomerase
MARRPSTGRPRASPKASRPLVLVTGAQGFAARFLVSRLLDEGFAVRAGDVVPPRTGPLGEAIPDARAEAVRLDITDTAAVEAAVRGCVAIFHFAALVPYNLGARFAASDLHRVNVGGTQTLLRAGEAAGVRHFLYASSTGVVFSGTDIANGSEDCRGADAHTSAPVPLNDAYSESKAAAEAAVLAASRVGGMACVAIRPNGIWGAGGEAHHIPKLLVAAQAGVAALMAVAPAARTDFTHRANLAHAFMLALTQLQDDGGHGRAAVAGRAYFVTDGWPCHTLEFFSPLLAGLGFDAPFPSAIVPEGTGGHERSVRLGRAEFDAAVASAAPATGGKRIILTSDPHLPLPAFVLYPAAAACELVAGVLGGEPFLTAADVRKVVRDNFYDSTAAASELGYAPVMSVGQGMAETVVYYRELGWDGGIHTRLGWAPWLLAPGGIALTGGLSLLLSSSNESTLPPALAQLLHGMAASVRACAPAASFGPRADDAGLTARLLLWVFLAAVTCHCLEAVWAFRLAWAHRLGAARWAVQTTVLGFPSLEALYSVVGGGQSLALVRLACVSTFLACFLLTPAVLSSW